MRRRKKLKKQVLMVGVGLVSALVLTTWTMSKKTNRIGHQTVETGSRNPISTNQMPAKDSQVEPVQQQTTIQDATQTTPSSQQETIPTTNKPKVTGINLSQIKAGDLSSLAGTWVSAGGQSLTFSSTGILDEEGQVQGLEKTDHGTLRGYIQVETLGGATIELLPSGVVFSDYTYDKEGEAITVSDASDSQTDRIWVGQDFASIGEASSFFYRIR